MKVFVCSIILVFMLFPSSFVDGRENFHLKKDLDSLSPKTQSKSIGQSIKKFLLDGLKSELEDIRERDKYIKEQGRRAWEVTKRSWVSFRMTRGKGASFDRKGRAISDFLLKFRKSDHKSDFFEIIAILTQIRKRLGEDRSLTEEEMGEMFPYIFGGIERDEDKVFRKFIKARRGYLQLEEKNYLRQEDLKGFHEVFLQFLAHSIRMLLDSNPYDVSSEDEIPGIPQALMKYGLKLEELGILFPKIGFSSFEVSQASYEKWALSTSG